MERIDIVACLDSGFVMPTGVMICSVCENNPDTEIVFHLVADESVTEKDKEDLSGTVAAYTGKEVAFYDIEAQRVDNFGEKGEKTHRITWATYYRLFIAEILPNSIHKVLYLDGDTIVRHSLLSLWQHDLSGVPLAAILDSSAHDRSYYERLEYPYSYGYFNSGVMLINLDFWREHAVTKLFEDSINQIKTRLTYHDQDILNLAFYDNKKLINLKYNFTSGYLRTGVKLHELINNKDFYEAVSNPAIIHYTGGKPWVRWYNRTDIHPYASTFYKYQQKTKWKDWPTVDRRPMMMRIRHFIANTLRKLKLKSPIPNNYIVIPPID